MTRLQFTGSYAEDGTPETFDPDAPASVQTKDTADAIKAAGPGYGAAINQHSGLLRVQQGEASAAAEADESAQTRVEGFLDNLDRLQSVTSAGRALDSKTIENLQHELNDTAIAYVRMGGSVNDDELVNLRSRVDAIAAAARRNK